MEYDPRMQELSEAYSLRDTSFAIYEFLTTEGFEQRSSLFHPTKGSDPFPTVWQALRNEVHLLLCTDDRKYKAERQAFKTSVKPAVAALATYLDVHFGIPVASGGAIAAVALTVSLKVGIQAWCNTQPTRIADLELAQLKDIASLPVPNPHPESETKP